MKRYFKALWAMFCADIWCLIHPGNCVMTAWRGRRVYMVEAGTGSLLKGTWKTNRVFYDSYSPDDPDNIIAQEDHQHEHRSG